MYLQHWQTLFTFPAKFPKIQISYRYETNNKN